GRSEVLIARPRAALLAITLRIVGQRERRVRGDATVEHDHGVRDLECGARREPLASSGCILDSRLAGSSIYENERFVRDRQRRRDNEQAQRSLIHRSLTHDRYPDATR